MYCPEPEGERDLDGLTCQTTVDPDSHLVKATEMDVGVDQQAYQSMVGSLIYLEMCTRPDTAYAVFDQVLKQTQQGPLKFYDT